MKHRTLIVMTVLGLMFLGVTAVAGADSGMRPFKGTASGEVSFNFVGTEICPPTDVFFGGLSTDSAAKGESSHLGLTTMESNHCTPAGNIIDGGHMTLTAADGDKVFIDYHGSAPFPIPGVTEVVEAEIDFAITGGTGRFSDATGGGHMKAYAEFLGLEVPVWPATWEWTGTIGY